MEMSGKRGGAVTVEQANSTLKYWHIQPREGWGKGTGQGEGKVDNVVGVDGKRLYNGVG